METLHSAPKPNLFESRWIRLLLVLVIFVAAILIGGKDYGLDALIGFFYFPMGLTILLKGTPFCTQAEWANSGCYGLGVTVWLVGWPIYLAVVVPLVLSRTRWLYSLLFLIFLGLILATVVGCQGITPHVCKSDC